MRRTTSVKPGLISREHPVAQARSGYEHGRAFGRPSHDQPCGRRFRRWSRNLPGAAGAFNGEVTRYPVGNSNALDTKPDARANPPAAGVRRRRRCQLRRLPAADASQARPSQQPATDPNAKKKKKRQEAATAAAAPPTLTSRAAAQPAARLQPSRSIELELMSRILLADDSPHAQRMGERILREEGFEVVSLTDGNAAMLRLADVDPDLILADVFLPGKSGFELCRYVKSEPRFKHVRVVLTAGLLEPFDEEEAKRAGCDAILKKPFEASKVVSTIDPLVKEAQLARGLFAEQIACRSAHAVAEAPGPPRAKPRCRTRPLLKSTRNAFAQPSPLALDAALPAMIQEITERVLIALGH